MNNNSDWTVKLVASRDLRAPGGTFLHFLRKVNLQTCELRPKQDSLTLSPCCFIAERRRQYECSHRSWVLWGRNCPDQNYLYSCSCHLQNMSTGLYFISTSEKLSHRFSHASALWRWLAACRQPLLWKGWGTSGTLPLIINERLWLFPFYPNEMHTALSLCRVSSSRLHVDLPLLIFPPVISLSALESAFCPSSIKTGENRRFSWLYHVLTFQKPILTIYKSISEENNVSVCLDVPVWISM